MPNNNRWAFFAIISVAIVALWPRAHADGVQNAASPAAIALMAPVQSVNALVGNVVVPTYQRQISPPQTVNTSDGTVAWHFPTTFNNTPSCFYSLAASTTTFTFDYPVQTAATLGSTTDVALVVSGHLKSLSILSIALPITLGITTAGVPAGTTITFSCLAPT